MDRPLRVLVAHNENDSDVVATFSSLLSSPKFIVEFAPGADACIRLVEQRSGPWDLVLMDGDPPSFGAIDALQRLRQLQHDLPVAMMSAYLTPKFLFETSQAGAHGFLNKPIRAGDLDELVATLPPRAALSAPEPPASMHVEDLGGGQFFLAASPAMLTILNQVRLLSRADVPVLITGESGVGKEVVANLIHKFSPRSNRTFLKVNCAALPTDLLESELFGYEAGAFTGAAKAKPGKFDVCDKGTILLDEIGEMSPQLQAKLLHVLQDGTFSRLGSIVNTKVDVRVIAATNVDIEQAIAEKRLREDLYYRLNAFVLRVPPLRERTQEIPWLLENLATKVADASGLDPICISPRLVAAAVRYQWPGNLRELGNFVKRYLIMRDETAALIELETKVVTQTYPVSAGGFVNANGNAAHGVDPRSAGRSIKDQTEIRMLRETLDETRWNRRIAAEKLQISYKSLLQKIRYYDLEASA
jgi:two-component system, NtrC family, response regulator AtoC